MAAEYTFSLSVHGIFSRIGHLTGRKTSLSFLKNIEIISGVFSCHSDIKLEIIEGKMRNSQLLEIKEYTMNNHQVTEETKRGG